MIEFEFFKPNKHYLIVSKWWSEQKWPVIPLSHLSQTGILVSHNGIPAACAWIYKTDSAFCWLEWTVANPEVRHEERSLAISGLVSCAKMLAKSMGFESIFMNLKSVSLATRIEKHGFTKTEENTANYICKLMEDK